MPWQPLPVLFPDVELVLTEGIRDLLAARSIAGVHVGRKIPEERQLRMIVVNRDGGEDDGVTDRPRVRFRVWDEDEAKVGNLARLVVALVQLLVGTTPIVRAEKISGPFEVPDTSRGHQRYLLFEIHTQGAQLS
ncbi:MAG TPA: hypothetical protein VNS46_00170 [Nocardioides sp.]|nr:hypothetical protein [Nocardioides sp.]